MPFRAQLSEFANALANPDDPTGGITRTTLDRVPSNVDVLDTLSRANPVTRVSAPNVPDSGSFGDRFRVGAARVGAFLENPDVQGALASFGMAFDQNSGGAGTILGQHVMNRLETDAERNLMSRLLAGESLADIPADELSQLSTEGLRSAIQVSQQQEQLGQSQQRIDQQERVLDLRERGIDLSEAGLDLDQEKFQLTERDYDHRVQMAEQQAEIEERLAESLIALREFEMSDEGQTRGRDDIRIRTNEFLQNSQRLLQTRQEQLRMAKHDLQTLEDERGIVNTRPGLTPLAEESGPLTFAWQSIFGRREAGPDPEGFAEAQMRVQSLEQDIQNLEQTIGEMTTFQQQNLRDALGSGEAVDPGETSGLSVEGQEAGEVQSVSLMETADLPAGSRIRITDEPSIDPNVVYEMQEDGSIIPVEE